MKFKVILALFVLLHSLVILSQLLLRNKLIEKRKNEFQKISAITALLFSVLACNLATPRGVTSTPEVVEPEPSEIPATKPTVPLDGPAIAGCPIFPANNYWNTPIDSLPTHPQSDVWIDSIGRNEEFHMDFGSGEYEGGLLGIPYDVVSGSSVTSYSPEFYYPDESDTDPYPILDNPSIEFGSDHHIIVVDTDTCKLYEIFDASFADGQWFGGSGAIFDLHSNALRPDTWTSADAAGLPILPGLVRYDEIEAGEIKHALRFTAEQTAGYLWPGRHQTADPDDSIPPLGARFRLTADYDISGFPLEMQVILQAFKTYGIVLADNGSDWYVSGAPDERWDNDMLHLLDVLTGNDFEAVDTSVMMVDVDSGEAK